MDAVYKALVNSVYGFCGASGCNYNAPSIAARVTLEGRNILNASIAWAEGRGFQVVNGDTDSISFTVPQLDGDYLKGLLKEVNALMLEGIRFEDDGFFPKFVILKAKNYIMLTPEGKIKIKGSALKSSKIEPGIKSFHNRCIRALLSLSDEPLVDAYKNICRDLASLNSVAEWSSKKTISEKTVTGSKKMKKDGTYPVNKMLNALKGTHFQLGDKFNFYTTNVGTLKLEEHYDPVNPDHDLKKLLAKIYKAAAVFDNVSPELKARTNYGLSTKAKEFNKMVRKKVLTEKVKKPTPKSVLENVLGMLADREIYVMDDYATDEWNKVMADAMLVLAPKPPKPKKNKHFEELKTALEQAIGDDNGN